LREFARGFYLSKEWRRTRAYIVARDHGLCVKCGRPGEIVHHKEHLTPENINTPEIALGENNLELLCRDCHALAAMELGYGREVVEENDEIDLGLAELNAQKKTT